MGFFGDAANRVRDFFRRDKEQAAVQFAKGATGSGYPAAGADIMQAYGYDVLADHLRVEQDLISRMVDYEEMDEYSLISTAIDAYADDASQPDSHLNRTLWVTSKDETTEQVLDDLFHRTLRLDEEIWEIARTVVKYGQNFEELLVNQDGVVGLNHLPPPTMRRIEGPRGQLYGYVQDMRGRFNYTPAEFQQIIAQRSTAQASNGEVSRGPGERVTALEDWEVVHFRHRGKQRRSIYGVSVLDAARWVWKRLTLLEDSALIYRLCLRGDTNVWTADGYKQIKDVQEGDVVLSYAQGGELKPSKVTYSKHNGKDKIYKVHSFHHDLYANATHPVLVEYWTSPGSGRGHRKQRVQEYVEVQNLKPGLHRFVMPHRTSGEEIRLVFPTIPQRARLNESAVSRRVGRKHTYQRLVSEAGIHHYKIRDFYAGNFDLLQGPAVRLLTADGYENPDSLLDLTPDWGGVEEPNFPEVATPDFARWFGFMLGDGWILENGKVGFSAGDDQVTNRRYKKLFEQFVGPLGWSPDHRAAPGVGSYSVGSVVLAEFLRLNGFIPGAYNKRIPAWVYRAKPEVGKALLEGLLDADGAWRQQTVSPVYKRIRYRRATLELCNKALVEDARQLALQLGYSTGRVLSGKTKGGREVGGHVLKETDSFSVDIRFCPPETSEFILSVTEAGEDDIYDIGVEAEEHNFVADGVVVHNTRSPERFAFYVDIGDLPPQEAMAYLNRVRQQHKKKKWVNPLTGKIDLKHDAVNSDDDFWVPVRNGSEGTRIEVLGAPNWQCLAASTQIPLLDGTAPTIKELSERKDSFWVYAIDAEHRIVPGEGYAARQTRPSAEIWEVGLDNGEVVSCTGNHPFLTRQGEYVHAENLKSGDSLMPLYRKISSKEEGAYLKGYEQLLDPKTDKYVYTHHRVFDTCFGGKEALWRSGSIIHHKNHRKLDNRPENLAGLHRKQHAQEHAEFAKYMHTPEARAKLRQTKASKEHRALLVDIWNRPGRKEAAAQRMAVRMRDPENRAASAERLAKWNRSQDHIDRISGPNHPRWVAIDEAGLAEMFREHGAQTLKELIRKKVVTQNVVEKVLRAAGITWTEFALKHIPGYVPKGRAAAKNRKPVYTSPTVRARAYRANKAPTNHKVVFVRKTERCEPVYCLTVKEHHNFAVAQGVFVKNSMEDIQYFRDQLFAAMKVPKAYLAQEGDVNRATLSSQDVKFARTVLRIQRELKNGFAKVARVHLAALDIDPRQAHYNLHMTVPSSIFELAQLEVKNARADLGQRMREFVSLHWVLANVFGMSDDEIDTIYKEQDEDQERNAYSQANSQSIVQKAVTQAGVEGQSAGQIAAQNTMAAELPPGSMPPSEQAAPKAQEHRFGPLILSRPARERRYYEKEQKLFEGGDRKSEKRALEKLETLLKSDRKKEAHIQEIKAMLRDIREVTGGKRR